MELLTTKYNPNDFQIVPPLAMWLRADSARPQRVSGSARTDSRRAESARNHIASHVKFGDDCANAQPGLF